MDIGGSDEHRALHHAVLARDAWMAMATERGYDEIAAIIRDAEAQRGHVNRRYESAGTPAPPKEFTAALERGDEAALIACLESSPLLRDQGSRRLTCSADGRSAGPAAGDGY